MTKEELQNYEPKGGLTGFPKEIIARMLQCQEEQGNKKDISVFEERMTAGCIYKGFDWNRTKEAELFWFKVIREKNFDIFFEKYPKEDNQEGSQEFKVGDKVIDIIYGEIGVIGVINLNDTYPIYVSFRDNTYEEYLINGVWMQNHKTPQLLHYRDDYDYSIIDFKNLPKRQEPKKRWRAKKGEIYYSIYFSFISNFKIEDYCEENDLFDDEAYDSGNYFRTEVEAETIAQKLNSYFKQLIKEEHGHKIY